MDETLDVVIPLYFDEENVKPLYERLRSCLLDQEIDLVRLVMVNDGSSDNTESEVKKICEEDSRVKLVQLTRNFGQHRAISAGLRETKSDLVVVMDSDLQDDPKYISEMINSMKRDKTKMAISRRAVRKEGLFKRFTSIAFNRISNLITPFNIDPRLGGYRVLSREIVDKLMENSESTGNPFAYLYYMGVDYSIVDVERNKRENGNSGYTFSKSFSLAMDRLLTYSIVPMRLAILSGIIFGILSLGLISLVIWERIQSGSVLPGWTSQVTLISIFGSMNLLFLGIIGEYLGRIYIESRGLPKYLVDYKINLEDDGGND